MKISQKMIKGLTSPFSVGVVVTFTITYLSTQYFSDRVSLNLSKDDHSLMGAISMLHQKSIDWRLTGRGQVAGSDQIAILAIDERAIQQEGRFPWPRDKQARMIEKALDYGAKSVSFDIVYSEADETSAIPTLRRLKRFFANNKGLKDKTVPVINAELAKMDGDQAFADMLKRKGSQLVLGSFFNEQENTLPYQDFCTDALFERTREHQYWRQESAPLTVNDNTADKAQFPPVLKEKLGEYFMIAENMGSTEWFDSHPEMIKLVKQHLDDAGDVIPPEAYPGFATLWINNDVENAQALFQQIKPSMASRQAVQNLFDLFGSAFTKQQAADLRLTMRQKSSKYCENFLTANDELLNEDAFARQYPESDLATQMREYQWQKIWENFQAEGSNRQPASFGSFEELITGLKTKQLKNSVTNTADWLVNIPVIGDQTLHTGYFNALLDPDGTVRRSFLLVRRGNSYMPSLAFKQFLISHQYTARVSIEEESPGNKRRQAKGVKNIEVFDSEQKKIMFIPVDHHGNLVINYAGGPKMFPHVSAADILNDQPDMTIEVQQQDPSTGQWIERSVKVDKREFLKDKMLIAGATATGIYDLRVTPFEENFPGVETHANVLSNLMIEHDRQMGITREPASFGSSGRFGAAPGFLHTYAAEERYLWVFLLFLGLALSAALAHFGAIAGLGVTTVTFGGVYLIDKYYFFRSGVITTVIFPLIEIAGTYVSLNFYKYFTEERKKRELKGTFEKYVSPAIVAEVLADPENIELGGKKVEMTVMFSDVRGFTTISEKLDPRQLSDLLNSYLTPMTALVFKNKGTLDKYMGDAIMAFWGAPIHFPDHAQHAARCALQMIDKLRELQAEYRERGLPEIDIGIGLNTGEMSVGNMGSETVRSYTVMGDSVNLGSRLEGINKQYGTRIIVSEFTVQNLGPGFIVREVDWVRVKGKAQPVRIFELMGEGQPKPEVAAMLEVYNQGFKLYHEKKFQEAIQAFEKALHHVHNDTVAELYIERCQDYQAEPPPENWDGVFTMTSK